HIIGAQTETHAREVGRAIARSALVKTAIYGGDPNWGRVLAAAGTAGVALVAERIGLIAALDNEWLTLASGGAVAQLSHDPARACLGASPEPRGRWAAWRAHAPVLRPVCARRRAAGHGWRPPPRRAGARRASLSHAPRPAGRSPNRDRSDAR